MGFLEDFKLYCRVTTDTPTDYTSHPAPNYISYNSLYSYDTTIASPYSVYSLGCGIQAICTRHVDATTWRFSVYAPSGALNTYDITGDSSYCDFDMEIIVNYTTENKVYATIKSYFCGTLMETLNQIRTIPYGVIFYNDFDNILLGVNKGQTHFTPYIKQLDLKEITSDTYSWIFDSDSKLNNFYSFGVGTSVSKISIAFGGSGYSIGDVLTLKSFSGGASATAQVTSVSSGSVSGVSLLTGGSGYIYYSSSDLTGTAWPITGAVPTTVSPSGGIGCYISIDSTSNYYLTDATNGAYVYRVSAPNGYSQNLLLKYPFQNIKTPIALESPTHLCFPHMAYSTSNSGIQYIYSKNPYDYATNHISSISGDLYPKRIFTDTNSIDKFYEISDIFYFNDLYNLYILSDNKLYRLSGTTLDGLSGVDLSMTIDNGFVFLDSNKSTIYLINLTGNSAYCYSSTDGSAFTLVASIATDIDAMKQISGFSKNGKLYIYIFKLVGFSNALYLYQSSDGGNTWSESLIA